MSLKIHYKRPPSPNKERKMGVQVDRQKESLGAIELTQLPYLRGAIGEIEGMFSGLSGLSLEGQISIIIHEGLYEVAGEVTIFEDGHHWIIKAVLIRASIIGHGIAATYAQMELRLRFTYTIRWS